MTVYIRKIEEYIKYYINLYGNNIIGQVLIGLIVYFMMMSLNLVNDIDGIWHLSNFIAGDWEISLGRGLLRYADRARFGIVSVPFNSILTLFLIAVGNSLIVSKLDIKNFIYKWLIYIILISNPVVCNSLSYSYTAVNYGLAYFFSILAFLFIKTNVKQKKKSILNIVIAASCLGVSMAFYQAYICVMCVLVIILILKKLVDDESIKEVLKYILACVCTLLLGGCIYFIITKALLYRAGVQLASYKGAENADILYMIKHLPFSIKQCYIQFSDYFTKFKAFSNLEFVDIVLGGIFIVYLVAVIIQEYKLFRKSITRGILFILMLVLLPVAGCIVLIIAVGNSMTLLMCMGLVMCTVMLGIIIPKAGKIGFFMQRVYIIVLTSFMWFQLSAVVNDQLALNEGKTATITLTENIICSLYQGGYLNESKTVAFIGRPGDNNMFAKSTAYQMANGYAMFGCWSTDARNNRVSWSGVTSNFCGVNLIFCSDVDYQILRELQCIKDMPEYPAEGSICIINNIVVIKVSNNY